MSNRRISELNQFSASSFTRSDLLLAVDVDVGTGTPETKKVLLGDFTDYVVTQSVTYSSASISVFSSSLVVLSSSVYSINQKTGSFVTTSSINSKLDNSLTGSYTAYGLPVLNSFGLIYPNFLPTGSVSAFNGRAGNVIPLLNDYSASLIFFSSSTNLPHVDVQAALGYLAINKLNKVGDTASLLNVSGLIVNDTASFVGYGVPTHVGFKNAQGTQAIPTATQANDNLGFVGWKGYTGSAFANAPKTRIQVVATENWTYSSNGARIEIYATPNGSNVVTNSAIISSNGWNGQIGFDTPNVGKFSSLIVNGTSLYIGGGTTSSVGIGITTPDVTTALHVSGTFRTDAIKYSADGIIQTRAPVVTFNGRSGSVSPQSSDYSGFYVTKTGNSTISGSVSMFGDMVYYAGYVDHIEIITASTLLTPTSSFIVCNSTSSLTMFLPSASILVGRSYTIKNKNSGSVIIDASYTGLLDGRMTASLSQWGYAKFVSDGQNWLTDGFLQVI